MTESNFVLNDSYAWAPKTISINDIIGAYNEMYMNLILLSSSCIVAYVIWNNFFIKSKYQEWLDSHDIDLNELAILPTIVLLIVTLAYKGLI